MTRTHLGKVHRLAVLALLLLPLGAGAWRSTLYPTDWQPPDAASVNFQTDKAVQDFSYAGYRAGEHTVPDVAGPVFNVTHSPYSADNTGVADATVAIQTAINAAQSAGGGVVFLPAGLYAVSPQGANSYALQITAANVILRGDGVGDTFLLNTSINMRSKSIILLSGPSAAGFYSGGAGSTVISQDLLGPALDVPVASTSGFTTGQWVVVRADCTDAWVTEHNEPGWLGYSNQLRGVAYFRRVVSLSGNSISLNAPTRYYLKTRDNARVVRLTSSPLLNCGLEDFSIGNLQHHGAGWGEEDYSVSGTGAYDVHDSFAIRMVRARDSWVRNVATFQSAGNTNTSHLLSNGILLSECSQVTLTNCHFQHSQYGGGGGNGYMYRLQNANECLLDHCHSTFTRHGFVLSHMGASGNVFHECTDKDSGRQTGLTGFQTTSGANSDHHMHFSHANLVDVCTGDGSVWEGRYRPYGSVPLHNLTAAHSVYWNTLGTGSGPGHVVQTEQSRYGYAIGTRGTRSGVSLSTYGGTKCLPLDHVEGAGAGATLEPFSLYLDQLNRRLNRPQVSLPAILRRGFPTNSVRLQPSVFISGMPANTNEFTAVWRVAAATGPVFFSSTNAAEPLVTFADRGTNELEVTVTANGLDASARVTVEVADDDATLAEALFPVADTYVRDGSFGDDNYGLDLALLLKKNSVAGYSRRAFLRFDVTSSSLTNCDRAFLELRTPSPPAAGTEPTLELDQVADDSWLETGVTWNAQPALGPAIASWPMSTNGLDRVEVTASASAAAISDGLLSLGLLVANPFSDTVYSFHSRETSEALRPRLVLELTNATVSFEEWIAGFTNPPPANLAPAADPDDDDLNNAEEFLFALDPTIPDASPLSLQAISGGVLLSYAQRKRLPAQTYYVIETVSTLAAPTWQPAPGVEFSFVGNSGNAHLMQAWIPVASDNQAFYRFRIVLGP